MTAKCPCSILVLIRQFVNFTVTFSSILYNIYINSRLSVTSDYGSILAMLLGSSRNGRLELARLLVPTTSGTVSVIQKDGKRRLTAPGSFNTCPMYEGQRCILSASTMLLWYTGPPSLGLDPKDSEILGLKACRRLFVNLTQLGLDPPTTQLTVQATSNCTALV